MVKEKERKEHERILHHFIPKLFIFWEVYFSLPCSSNSDTRPHCLDLPFSSLFIEDVCAKIIFYDFIYHFPMAVECFFFVKSLDDCRHAFQKCNTD